MLSCVLLLSSLLPLQVQCVPAPIPLQRDFNIAPQAPLTTAYSPSASLDPAPNSSAVYASSTNPLVMAYYAGWAGDHLPPKNIDFSLFDWIDFAFATPKEDFGIGWESENSPGLLRELVMLAHKAGTKVKLSVGGWTDSKYFSSAVATDESRETFASNIKDVYDEFGLDGIDIDWEYPGRQGDSGNIVGPDDSSNFLSFLQVLRRVLPPDARITAATTTVPFADASGGPLEDVSDFARCLDWILLMNYDVWGSPGVPGPNAPLSDYCHNSTQPEANAVAGFDAWTSAGFPANKLVLGLPSYGYVYTSDAHRLRQRANLKGRDQDAEVTVMAEDGFQVLFRELVGQGALGLVPASGDRQFPRFEGDGGFVRHWDGCSSTPFLRSSRAGQVIAYDDPQSLAMKAEFVRRMGMLGVNIFDAHGDTEEWHLTDTVRKAVKGFYDSEGTEV